MVVVGWAVVVVVVVVLAVVVVVVDLPLSQSFQLDLVLVTRVVVLESFVSSCSLNS